MDGMLALFWGRTAAYTSGLDTLHYHLGHCPRAPFYLLIKVFSPHAPRLAFVVRWTLWVTAPHPHNVNKLCDWGAVTGGVRGG